ncbi:MAG: type I-C CRISPR-associated protein Cas5 [Deltaproteobacteria bacterium]|nr:type I-C CRISPR-associated protein Cas5 [Deltaproteobacteria bacterium]
MSGERVESGPLRLRARGELACFTRPEFKVERVSYEVITPSAARALFECVLWKPQLKWEVHEVAVLAPVQWSSFRRNEVKSRAGPRCREIIADEDRTQRNTVALRDVDYVLTASFALNGPSGPDCNVPKYLNMFRERLARGQHHRAPYLGCREFSARLDEAPASFECFEGAHGVRRSLGWMFYDYHWPAESDADLTRGPGTAMFFEAWLDGGVMKLPRKSEVLAMHETKGGGRTPRSGA